MLKAGGGVDIMTTQEKVNRYIQFNIIRSHIDGIELLVHMIICVNNATKKVDFIKQPIFGGADVPKGVVAGIMNFGIAHHISTEIV